MTKDEIVNLLRSTCQYEAANLIESQQKEIEFLQNTIAVGQIAADELHTNLLRANDVAAKNIKDLREAFASDLEWRYSHDEIEMACGRDAAMNVREKVMKRRTKILVEHAKASER